MSTEPPSFPPTPTSGSCGPPASDGIIDVTLRVFGALQRSELTLPPFVFGPVSRGTVFGDMGDTSGSVAQMHVFVSLLLLLRLWGCGHPACDVHKSTGLSQIDGADLLGTEMNVEHPVLRGRAQRDRLAAEWPAEANAPGFEADITFLVGLAQEIVGPVLDRRQGLRKRATALLVALARRCHPDRLMRPLVIVDVPPAVERALARGQIREGAIAQDFALERAMEALILALRLRMIGPAMRHPHPQAHQPHTKRRVSSAAGIAPRRAIVHEHGIGQAVAPEYPSQAFARGTVLLGGASLYAQSVARMVVDHGQRMAAPAPSGEVALEVHLPELVGLLALEALIWTGMLRLPLLEPAVPAQNLCDRARRRNNRLTIAPHHMGDLAPAPGVVALFANAQNLAFHRFGRARRAAMRPTRPIGKPRPPFRRIALKPLVAFRATDAEPSTQLPLVHSRRKRKPHELLPLIHDRQLPQGHRVPPRSTKPSRTSVPHVPERCPPCPQSIHVGGEGRLPKRSEDSRGGGIFIRSESAGRPPTPSLPTASRGEGGVRCTTVRQTRRDGALGEYW